MFRIAPAIPMSPLCRAGLALITLGLAAGTAVVPANAQSNPVAKKRSCDRIARELAVARKPVEGRKLDEFLFDASRHGCDALLDNFVGRGASIKARDRFGNTALSIAARMGHRSTTALLIDRGSDLNHQNLMRSSVLLRAVTQRRRSVTRLLLKKGADPNAANRRGVSPLIAAAFNGDGRTVKELLAAGADPGHQDATGKGAIVYAAGRGFGRITELLLNSGLNPDKAYGNGLTALMWVAGHSNGVPESDGLETAQVLIAKTMDVDSRDNRGRTALMIAAERGHAKIVAALLTAGAKRELRDKAGHTALSLAADDATRSLLKP